MPRDERQSDFVLPSAEGYCVYPRDLNLSGNGANETNGAVDHGQQESESVAPAGEPSGPSTEQE